MKPVKRIEIVVDSLDVKMVLQELEDIGITSYSLIRDVVGAGSSGARSGDLLNDAMNNSYILIACDAAEVARITEALAPKLKRYGGLCLVSDAEMLQY